MTYMPNTIFSCQTTFKKAKFLEFGLKNANLATLVQSGRIFGFFGFGLDIVSFQPDPETDYPNQIKCGHSKNLDME